MSHTILYNRLFIKMPDGTYIALVQSGDNNVTTINPKTGREIADREWSSWRFGEKKTSYSTADILRYLNAEYSNAVKSAENHLQYHPQDWNGGNARDDAKRRFGYYSCVATKGHSCQRTTFAMFSNFFTKGADKAVTLEEFLRKAKGLILVSPEKKLMTPLTNLDQVMEAVRNSGNKDGYFFPLSEPAVEKLTKEK